MDDFHFLRPLWLLALLALPLLDRLLRHGAMMANAWSRVIEARLLPYVLAEEKTAGASSAWMRWVPLVAFTLSVVALAGPVWRQLPQPVLRDQSSLVILFDLSQSMNAADIAPSRLERARLKVIDLLERREDGQTALVGYAGLPFVVSPLTSDSATIKSLVPVLNPQIMPAGGSRADRALEMAADLIDGGGDGNGNVLLVTDGVEARDVEMADRLNARGITISVLAVGTRQGAPVRTSSGSLLKDDDGSIIHSRLTESSLRRLASRGGGGFSLITIDDADLDRLQGVFDAGGRFESEDAMSTDLWREEGPLLLLPILPLAALMFRRGVLVLLVGMFLVPLTPPAHAFDWEALWQRRDQRGVRALAEEDVDQALSLLDDPQWQSAALYRDKQYAESAGLLDQFDSDRALYNRATAVARAGDYPAAIEQYQQLLERSPDHEDARHNLEVLLDALEQQQQEGEGEEGEEGPQMPQSADASGAQGEGGQGQDQQGGRSQGAGESEMDEQLAEQSNDAGGMTREEIEREAEERAARELPDAEREGEEGAEQRQTRLAEAPSDAEKQREQQAAVEQWLRRIPDDPGGLLRRKFLYELQRRRQAGEVTEEDPW
jgi:Ca-activated chloride channel family protein